jgi:glycosyltransferase involved in cell wall biosynthesis
MKILFVTPHYEPALGMGGVVKSLIQLCRGLVNLGQEITVFTTNNNRLGERLEVTVGHEVDVGGVKVWYFPTEFFNKKFFYSPSLGKACYRKMHKFDLLHLVSFWCYPGLPAGSAARRHIVPYIMSAHGTLDSYSLKQGRIKKIFYLNLFERQNLKSAAAIHYTTDLERDRSHTYNRLKNPSFVVPNPVPVNEATDLPNKEKAREYFSLPQDAHVISFVGRLNKIKALDILLQAFKKLSLLLKSNCYILIAGPDDGDEARLSDIVIKNGLSDKVKFLGFVDAKKRGFVLKASDLFWLASYEENFGHSAVEAMAAGVPVILSEYVGIYREVLQDDAGIIVSHDSENIAKKVVALMTNIERKMRMSENAKKAVQRYEQNHVIPLMLKAYQDVLTGQRNPECNWKD